MIPINRDDLEIHSFGEKPKQMTFLIVTP